MDVKRHAPPKEQRAPGFISSEADQAYRKVVRKILTETEIIVSEEKLDKVRLQKGLDLIEARGRKYYPDTDAAV